LLKIAVDVGGTFTDTVAADDTGKLFVLKIRSTPAAPDRAFLSSVTRLLMANRLSTSEVRGVVHVGTIGTNLFLGQMGLNLPKTALISTRWFRDVLEIGRQNRAELYNIFFQRPTPLVPRRLRFEVSERVDAEGGLLQRVSESELSVIAAELASQGIEAVAVSYLNSYLNSENEQDTKRKLSQELQTPIFTSSEVDPEHREYERTSTTVVNAVLAPVVSRYLGSALNGLRASGIKSDLQILSSSGGLVDVEEVKRRPIMAIESGPAAGVVGAAEVAKLLGLTRAISFDMGGTSAKAGSIVDYTAQTVPEIEVGGRIHAGRTIKGSGYPVRYPSIDLAEVSAGGGTIIWADEAGTLRVGPMSAGAEPGPACYGAGGNDPTITDANLILGRIGSELSGGEVKLQRGEAEKALRDVGQQSGFDMISCADAAVKLVNLQMAKAIHIVSLERGLDPHEFALIAFGGAGPMHAVQLAEEVGIDMVIVPPWPGLFSALSMLMSDLKYNQVKGILRSLDELTEDELDEAFQSITNSALSQLNGRGIETSEARVVRTVDVRYVGQGYELEIEAPTPFSKRQVTDRFEKRHETVYGYRHSGERLEITALRLTVTIPVQKLRLENRSTSTGAMDRALVSKRQVWFNEKWHEAPVYSRNLLPTNAKINGPAIIMEYDSTLVLPPRWDCMRNEMDCLVVRRATS